jgi:hypothetical protein
MVDFDLPGVVFGSMDSDFEFALCHPRSCYLSSHPDLFSCLLWRNEGLDGESSAVYAYLSSGLL